MNTTRRRFKVSGPLLEWIIAASVVAAAIALVPFEVWVFRGRADGGKASIWQILLSDRATLGFLRLLLAVSALYAVASIAVLVARRRWLQTISTTGIEAESASFSDETIEELRAKLQHAIEERDHVNRLLWRYLHG